jgi:hypothetical protein
MTHSIVYPRVNTLNSIRINYTLNQGHYDPELFLLLAKKRLDRVGTPESCLGRVKLS